MVSFRIDHPAWAVLEWEAQLLGVPVRSHIRQLMESHAAEVARVHSKLDYDPPMR